MNFLSPGENKLTMSSREIAELVQSRHTDVCRSIERLMQSGVISGYAPMPYTHQQNNQVYHEYHIGKRDSYVIVAQLSPQFTAALVDRWQELEESRFKIPQTYSEALQLCADQAKQLELAAPKVAFVDRLVERNTLMTSTQVAQKHGKSAVWLNKFLEEVGVFNRAVKRGRAFQQWFIEKGYGEMKQTELGHSQALFTPSGELWISEKLTTESAI